MVTDPFSTGVKSNTLKNNLLVTRLSFCLCGRVTPRHLVFLLQEIALACRETCGPIWHGKIELPLSHFAYNPPDVIGKKLRLNRVLDWKRDLEEEEDAVLE